MSRNPSEFLCTGHCLELSRRVLEYESDTDERPGALGRDRREFLVHRQRERDEAGSHCSRVTIRRGPVVVFRHREHQRTLSLVTNHL